MSSRGYTITKAIREERRKRANLMLEEYNKLTLDQKLAKLPKGKNTMRILIGTILSICLAGCAYGAEEPEQQHYGKHTPEVYDGSDPLPTFTDPNANDPYYTGCFWEAVNEYDAGVAYFYVCDGQPFNVNDLIDPPPDEIPFNSKSETKP